MLLTLYVPTQKWPPGPQIAINYDISWLQGAHLGPDPSLLLNIQQLPLFTSKAAASRGGFQEGNYIARWNEAAECLGPECSDCNKY